MQLGLRLKSALVLTGCIAAVLALALAAGWRALGAVEGNLGTAFARNATQYNKQRILAPVLRELVLSQRLADSEVTRRWLLDENDPAKKALFFAEAERYRLAFADHSYFVISRASDNYYFNDDRSAASAAPRYALHEADPSDAWFFSTMAKTADFNINVDPDAKLKLTKVWFNVLVKDGGRNIGLAGTGLDLTQFLDRFIADTEPGVTPMILDRQGAIQAHPDRGLIDYSSVTDKGAGHSLVYRILTGAGDEERMRGALARAAEDADGIQVFEAEVGGRPELVAVTFVPELGWYVATAVDVRAARVLDRDVWLPIALTALALTALLLVAIVLAVDRMLLAPVLTLTDSARAAAAGDYAVELPPAGRDELGELTRAFGAMTAQVRSHTEELEGRVRERTRELVDVNERMAEANTKIGDSIRYASMIQNAILPDGELDRALGDSYFVLWRPRDVVGGDFYVFRADERGCLLGVVDCAGHGVPGAFMTMLAHAAVNVSIDALGPSDPAALLAALDARVRASLGGGERAAGLATDMDAGFAYVDFAAREVTFAGAKVSLYWCDGGEVGEVKGERRALAGRRGAAFANHRVALDARRTFYLTTDGILDQAGGPDGYGFGHARFADMLMRHAARPLAEQRAAFLDELAAYQGSRPQRDDITVLSFRFAQP